MTEAPSAWLTALRRRHGLRQADITHRTHALGGRVSRSTVSHLENGRLRLTALRPDQARALSHVLAITPEEWASVTKVRFSASGGPDVK